MNHWLITSIQIELNKVFIVKTRSTLLAPYNLSLEIPITKQYQREIPIPNYILHYKNLFVTSKNIAGTLLLYEVTLSYNDRISDIINFEYRFQTCQLC